MRKLIFMIRYTLYMNKRVMCGLKFGWHNAKITVEEMEWKDDSPKYFVDEEISCWHD